MTCSSRIPPACAMRLDQQHAGHHRVAREVAEEELLVDGDVLDRRRCACRARARGRGPPAGTDSGAAAPTGSTRCPTSGSARSTLRAHRRSLGSVATCRVPDAEPLLERAEPPAHLRQPRQRGHLAPPARASSHGGNARPRRLPAGDRRERRRLRRHLDAGRRARGARDPRLARQHDAVAQPGAAGDARLAAEDRSAGRAARCGRPGPGCRSWCRRRSRVSPSVARSIVVLAPISTSSSTTTRPICGTLWWAPLVGGVAEAVGAEHGAGVDDAPGARARCRRRARRAGGGRAPSPTGKPPPTTRRRCSTAPAPDPAPRADHHVAVRRRRVGSRRCSPAPTTAVGWTPGAAAPAGWKSAQQLGPGRIRIAADQQVAAGSRLDVAGPTSRAPAPARRRLRAGSADWSRNERCVGTGGRPAAGSPSTARSGLPSHPAADQLGELARAGSPRLATCPGSRRARRGAG